MWAQHVPSARFWRELPVLIVAALAMWGLMSPRTQWAVLWGWQRRYRHLQTPQDRAQAVRRSVVVPLVLCIFLALVLWPNR